MVGYTRAYRWRAAANELKLIGVLLRPVLLSMNRALASRSHRRGHSILLFVAGSQPAPLSAPVPRPRLSGILSLSGRRMAINPGRSWGPGLLKLLYGSEPKSDGLRFEIPARARAHIQSRAGVLLGAPVLCLTRVRVACVDTHTHTHMSSPRSSLLSFSLRPTSARYHPGSGDEHENEGPK